MKNRLASIAIIVVTLSACFAIIITAPLNAMAQSESKGMMPEGMMMKKGQEMPPEGEKHITEGHKHVEEAAKKMKEEQSSE